MVMRLQVLDNGPLFLRDSKREKVVPFCTGLLKISGTHQTLQMVGRKGGSGNCYQTLIFATGEQSPSLVHNTCHSIDPQGDAAVYIGKFDPTIGKFTGGFVSGTGKYAGLAPANLIFEGVDFDQTSGKYTWTSAN